MTNIERNQAHARSKGSSGGEPFQSTDGIQLEDQPALVANLISWAELIAQMVQVLGRPLDEAEIETARQMGVQNPGNIKVLVSVIPLPEISDFSVLKTELHLPHKAEGLALGYSLLLAREPEGPRDELLLHEFRHVQQCERWNGLAPFITEYLGQLERWGYEEAPLERDAREASEKNIQKIYGRLKNHGNPSVINKQLRGSR